VPSHCAVALRVSALVQPNGPIAGEPSGRVRRPPKYSSRERAALAWTEAVTELTDGAVPDIVYETARREFDEAELAKLTLAVATINSWNRLNIAFRTTPGSYRPPLVHRANAVTASGRSPLK
jgi:hypothetical protein